jgi:ribonucleoside-diphosphate reductase alpha chain
MVGSSGGLEPVFQLSYTRKSETLHTEDKYYEVFTPIVKEYMKMHNITKTSELPSYFITTSNLDYKARIRLQSAWQQYIDASISSTINLPEEASIEEVENLYMYAWEQQLKGVTIYRENCDRAGILITDKAKSKQAPAIADIESLTIEDLEDLIYEKSQKAILENPNVCPMCGGEMFHSGGCTECKDCAYSPCSI